MHIIKKETIQNILKSLELVPIIEDGFIAYSKGKSVVPPVGELTFAEPPGDVHIKYGYIIGDSYYVIKVASGFWENEKYGVSNGQGMMLLFCQKTGQPKAVLLDDAILTDIRTAIAGQICARRFANKIEMIGVLGTGLQARLQVQYLSGVTECRQVMVWGRSSKKMKQYKNDMKNLGFEVLLGKSAKQVASVCNFIITATASKKPLLFKNDILEGTHITAMGSDTPDKRELGPGVVKSADIIVADSIIQCQERGEIANAIKDGDLFNNIVELGNVLSEDQLGRTNDRQITIADLTGVAVQDVQIATAVYNKYLENNNEI